MSMGRLLGIDYGMKRIGLALSDPSKILASPLPTLEAERKYGGDGGEAGASGAMITHKG